MSTLNTCTQLTRPSSPGTGDMLFETDTNKCIIYDGAAWRVADPTFSLEPQTGDWLTIELPHRDSIYNGTGNTMVSYGYWLYSVDSSKLGGHGYNAASILETFSSDIGMNIFNGNDDVLIDAIRFRCNRPAAGAGSFGFHLARFTKWQTAISNGGYNSRYSGGSSASANTQATIGTSTSNDLGDNYDAGNTVKGRSFVAGDPTNVLLNDGTTGATASGLLNIVTETDPLGKDDAKSNNTDWWVTHQWNANWNPSSPSSHSQVSHYFLNRSLAGGISNNGFGIYGGVNMPQEVFFTFFFTTPLNMKGLTSIDWMPWEAFGRTSLDINVEFRKHS